MRTTITLVLLAMLAAAPAAEATGIRIGIGGGASRHDAFRGGHPPRHVTGMRGWVAPRAVYVVPTPVYVTPSCYLPGRWDYQWIPQTYSYNAWVPAAWAPDGTWIDGHYETRLYATGYYQPYWVAGRAC